MFSSRNDARQVVVGAPDRAAATAPPWCRRRARCPIARRRCCWPDRVWISAAAPSTATSTASAGGADIQQAIAPDRARIARHQRGLAEHDLLQQPREEIAAALLRPQRRRALLVDAEAARHRAGQPVDRRAFLRAGRDVDAAQERCGIEPGAAERLAEELLQRGRPGWRPAPGNRRSAVRRSGLRSACSRSSRRSFRRCTSKREFGGEGDWRCRPPSCSAGTSCPRPGRAFRDPGRRRTP